MDEAGGLTWALILTVAMGTHAALSDDAAQLAATQQKILETAGPDALAIVPAEIAVSDQQQQVAAE